jgi:TfoX/Sxy family transcriptional regulator of competence genes
MAYNQKLNVRIRDALKQHPDIVEKKMFGGVGFMLRGNMACGVQGEDLIVRIGEAQNNWALAQPFVRPFMPVQGRPMAGWILVAPDGTESEEELVAWIKMGIEFAATLPVKK